MTRRTYVILGILLAGALFAISSTWILEQDQVPISTLYPGGAVDPVRTELYWSEQLKKYDPLVAREKFEDSIDHLIIGYQHIAAHIFGGALYEHFAAAGMAFCNTKYESGCFHEFVGRAIASEGVEVVRTLSQTCMELSERDRGMCHHSMGHGISAALGYEDEDLLKSLEVCDFVTHDELLMSPCRSGVLMEFNMRTVGFGELPVRPQDEYGDIGLCDTIPEKYRFDCIFRLPQWWYSLSERTQIHAKRDLEDMGARCNEVSVEYSDQLACFMGIGSKVVPFASGYQADKMVPLCDIAAASATSELRDQCVHAAVSFMQWSQGNEFARSICGTMPKERYEACLVWANDRTHTSCSTVEPILYEKCMRTYQIELDSA